MFISDLIIGLYSGMIFTYIALTLIGLIYYFIFYKITYKNLFFIQFSVLLFFIQSRIFSFGLTVIYMKKILMA